MINKSRGSIVSVFDEDHMSIRKQFGLAKFVVDISEKEIKNPFKSFESLTSSTWPQKEYSLHKLPPKNYRPDQQVLVDTLRRDTRDYINQTYGPDKTAIPSEWCTYCVHRGMCMEPFLAGN